MMDEVSFDRNGAEIRMKKSGAASSNGSNGNGAKAEPTSAPEPGTN
jgi:hypothetical protein